MRKFNLICISAALLITSCTPVVKEYKDLKGRSSSDEKANNELETMFWPGGCKAAVCLTYDGGLLAHLDVVIPALREYNLRGSFFLSGTSSSLDSRLDEWREAAAAGHELGNISRDLRITPDLRITKTLLRAIDGKTERSCALLVPDSGFRSGVPDSVYSGMFVCMRIYGSIPDSIAVIDTFRIPSINVMDAKQDELIAYAREAAEKGTLAVFSFNNIGEDDMDKEVHESFIKYLDSNRDTYWTDTFLNISKHLKDKLNQ